jgi:predicted O-methyltransferase YrrM
MTPEWLGKYYGSKLDQVEQTKGWLLQYNPHATVAQIEKWKYFKHLSEYSSNTHDIVQQCLDKITGKFEFESELQAHRFVNMLRVPISASYEDALSVVKPKTILELGVGGDSGISTSVYLAYIEKNGRYLHSIELNPLGMTGERYAAYLDKIWRFKYDDSVTWLNQKVAEDYCYDMIFIDTSHTYLHTSAEMQLASQITDNMLMDDALFPGNTTDTEQGGVVRAIAEWVENNKNWEKIDFWGGNTVLLTKNDSKPQSKKSKKAVK